MPRREIKAYVTADTKDFKKGLSEAEKSASKLHSALDRFGPVGKGAANVLEKLGFSSLGAAAGVGAAAAALGAGVAVAEKAIGKYVHLTESVERYQNVTGQSAEESSRQVQAFRELGIEEEVAAAGMVKLSKAIETTPDKLHALGIQIVTTKDGTVDLNGTLLSVVQAWQGTEDAAKRNLIVLTAFGKAGAAMIPILKTNSAELKRLEDSVSKVITQEDIEKVRAYKIAQKEAERAADDWGVTLGQTLLPAQKAVYDSLNENVYVNNHLDEAMQKVRATSQGGYADARLVAAGLRKQWEESQKAQDATDKLGLTMKDAADAAQREADAEQRLSDAIDSALDKTLDYRQAVLDLKKAQKDATDGKGKDAEANLRLERAYLAVANAVLARAQAQAVEKGQTLSAAEADKIKADALQLLVNKLDPKSPLRKELQAYIDQLRSIPTTVNTNITTNLKGARAGNKGSGGGVQMAEGGIVKAAPGGTQVTLGEGGHDEAVVPLNGSSSAGGGGNHFHFHDAVYADGPGLDRLARALIGRGRRTPGT